jgi:arylsulfatase A-like enzyme
MSSVLGSGLIGSEQSVAACWRGLFRGRVAVDWLWRSRCATEMDVVYEQQSAEYRRFFWDNLAWGEVGCYGGGVLRGAPTPRIDQLAADGLKLLNFNVEAQCTPSRSALLTGRHPLRSGTQTVPITGGPGGLARWEVTIAQALSDAGYATGMWGKWHLGSDPEQRSPVDFGFDEAVWSPRTADEVLWTMQSYFPDGAVTSAPYAGDMEIPLEPEPIYSRVKGAKPEVIATYDAEFRAGFDRKITDWAIDFMARSKRDGKPFYV